MEFKLDENLGIRFKKLLIEQGFKADTIYDEGLQGSSDLDIFNTIIKEKKCLISLDLDFSDVTRFPPKQTNGIVILRLHKKFSFELAETLLNQFVNTLNNNKSIEALSGNLWIVEFGRIRIHQS